MKLSIAQICVYLITLSAPAYGGVAIQAVTPNPEASMRALDMAKESRVVQCARALFEYKRMDAEYDLETLVERIAIDHGYTVDESNVQRVARITASFLGMPEAQEAMREHDVREFAVMRPESHGLRRSEWAQLLAVYKIDGVDSPEAYESIYGESVSARVHVWRNGILSFRLEPHAEWTSIARPGGHYLVPSFYKFGSNENYIREELFDESRWHMSVDECEEVIRYRWEMKQGASIVREVGVEISKSTPHRLQRAWRGFIGAPTREAIFSDYVEVDGEIAYPQVSIFRNLIPLDDDVIVAREETYRLLESHVSFNCEEVTPSFDDYRSDSGKSVQRKNGPHVNEYHRETEHVKFHLPGTLDVPVTGVVSIYVPNGSRPWLQTHPHIGPTKLLCVYAGLTQADAARELGMGAGAVVCIRRRALAEQWSKERNVDRFMRDLEKDLDGRLSGR